MHGQQNIKKKKQGIFVPAVSITSLGAPICTRVFFHEGRRGVMKLLGCEAASSPYVMSSWCDA